MDRVLITGATGFIGGWVTEAFTLAGIPLRAGVRRWNSAARIARRKVEMAPCDVLNPEQVRKAMQGCDSVVHCAVGDATVTVEGTRHVLQVASDLGVRRVVHLSSVAIYGAATGRIDERHELRSDGNAYAKAKVAAEHVCAEFAARGLPVVLLRPSIVYGPFSTVWTLSFARRLHSGHWGTFGSAGEGKCNLVYVTDVVQAIQRALVKEVRPGDVWNINGGEIITWNEYFVRFNAALGLTPLSELSVRKMLLRARLLRPVRATARYALRRFGKPLMRLHSKSPLAAGVMKATESSLKLTPTLDQLKRFRQDATYLIDKAREELGYAPCVSVDEGLACCAAWLKHHRLLYGREDSFGETSGREETNGADSGASNGADRKGSGR